MVTQMGMGSAQAINAAWLASKMEDYKRPIALAAYVISIQLAGFPGNQLFRDEGMFYDSQSCMTRSEADFKHRRTSVHTGSAHRCGLYDCWGCGHVGLEGSLPSA